MRQDRNGKWNQTWLGSGHTPPFASWVHFRPIVLPQETSSKFFETSDVLCARLRETCACASNQKFGGLVFSKKGCDLWIRPLLISVVSRLFALGHVGQIYSLLISLNWKWGFAHPLSDWPGHFVESICKKNILLYIDLQIGSLRTTPNKYEKHAVLGISFTCPKCSKMSTNVNKCKSKAVYRPSCMAYVSPVQCLTVKNCQIGQIVSQTFMQNCCGIELWVTRNRNICLKYLLDWSTSLSCLYNSKVLRYMYACGQSAYIERVVTSPRWLFSLSIFVDGSNRPKCTTALCCASQDLSHGQVRSRVGSWSMCRNLKYRCIITVQIRGAMCADLCTRETWKRTVRGVQLEKSAQTLDKHLRVYVYSYECYSVMCASYAQVHVLERKRTGYWFSKVGSQILTPAPFATPRLLHLIRFWVGSGVHQLPTRKRLELPIPHRLFPKQLQWIGKFSNVVNWCKHASCCGALATQV